MKTDIITIGAEPTGLCLARSLANTSINIIVIDKQPLASLSKSNKDGRDITLTHFPKETVN